MKKALVIFFCMIAAGLSAQVDSFMVQGNAFHFTIPENWVLVERGDSVQKFREWNINREALNY